MACQCALVYRVAFTDCQQPRRGSGHSSSTGFPIGGSTDCGFGTGIPAADAKPDWILVETTFRLLIPGLGEATIIRSQGDTLDGKSAAPARVFLTEIVELSRERVFRVDGHARPG